MKNHLSLLHLTLLVILTSVSIFTTSAQESSGVYVLRDDALLTLSPDTGTQTVVADLERLALPVTRFSSNAEPRYVASADLVEDPLTLYVLLHEGKLSAQLPFPTQTQILRVDPQMQTSTVIYERPGIFTFVLSPDGQQMIVGYYESDYYFSTQRACVLDFQTDICGDIPHAIANIPGQWIDEVDILVLSGDDLLPHVINSNSGVDVVIPIPLGWNLISSIPIPNAHLVVLTMGRIDLNGIPEYRLFTVDIDTMQIEMLQYENDRQLTSLLGFSPHSRYLFYNGATFELIEFATGRVISVFDRVINFGWESNETLVIQGTITANAAPVIAQVNAVTGEIRTLAEGEQAAGILIVP